MKNYLLRIIKKYKSIFCIPKENEQEYEDKNLKIMRWVTLVLAIFGLVNALGYGLLRKDTLSPENYIQYLAYYSSYLVFGGILSITCFLMYKKNIHVNIKRLPIYSAFVFMTAITIFASRVSTGLSFLTPFVIVCIESLLIIAFLYIRPVVLAIIIIILNIALQTTVFNTTPMRLNFSIISILIVYLNFSRLRMVVRNIKQDKQLKNQAKTLTEQTIELQAQQNELLRLKDILEEKVGTQQLEIQSKNEKLIQIQKHIILSLSALVENRDKDTGKHVYRTSAYVKLLAQEAQKAGLFKEILTDEYVDLVEKAAPLHDIGKILISDVILKKPGKLTDVEFKEMQRHAAEGGKIIDEVLGGAETVEYVQIATEIAEGHHEKWNGLGYPKGLAGQNIPLSARFMALADVFDALVSARCYKDPIPVEDAFTIINDGAGSHFDPELTKIFMDNKDKILKIKAKYIDSDLDS